MTRGGGGGVALVILVFFGVYMNVGVAYFHSKCVSGAGFCYGKRLCTGLGWWSGCMDSRPRLRGGRLCAGMTNGHLGEGGVT